jgi:hypothetical protein
MMIKDQKITKAKVGLLGLAKQLGSQPGPSPRSLPSGAGRVARYLNLRLNKNRDFETSGRRSKDPKLHRSHGQGAGRVALWSLNRLSPVRARRLIGGIDFRLPCGRCQLYWWVQYGRSWALI